MTFPLCPMGSSPVSVAEPPAQCTYLWRIEEHLFAPSLGPFVSKRYHVNSELWGTSAAPLYRFLRCCLTTSHLLLSILLTIRELSHSAQLRHRQRSLGEEAHLNSLSSSLLPHAHPWLAELLAPGHLSTGEFLLAGPHLCAQSQGFGLDSLNCVSCQTYCFPKLFFFSSRGFYVFPDVSL